MLPGCQTHTEQNDFLILQPSNDYPKKDNERQKIETELKKQRSANTTLPFREEAHVAGPDTGDIFGDVSEIPPKARNMIQGRLAAKCWARTMANTRCAPTTSSDWPNRSTKLVGVTCAATEKDALPTVGWAKVRPDCGGRRNPKSACATCRNKDKSASKIKPYRYARQVVKPIPHKDNNERQRTRRTEDRPTTDRRPTDER